ncbi:MAG: hypothetical protein Hens3KO_14220 [Henriciella sp.]
MKIKSNLVPMTVALLFFAAACETVPAVQPMTPEAFAEMVEYQQRETNPVLAEQPLTKALQGQTLSPEQRHEVLYARALARWNGGYNKPGAMADMLALVSAETPGPHTNVAATAIDILGQEISEHRARLAGLQSQSAWFDDKKALGDLEDVATRYRDAGLTPNQAQAEILVAAGFICSGETEDSSVQSIHAFDDLRDYADGLYWCLPEPIT